MKNSLDGLWFIPSVISNIDSKTDMAIDCYFMFIAPIFKTIYIRFV